MKSPIKFAYRVNGVYVRTLEDYCNAYLASRLSPEEIAKCIQLVYFQAYYVYFEQGNSTEEDLLHTDRSGRHFLLVKDYSLKVFLDISRPKQICVLMDAVFI